MKKISVVITIYKVELYIAATVQSVLDQTYQNFEILIIDDASPDRSVEICRQFNDSRIRIIQQENRGTAGALNTGIRHSQGEYIALLDGDDLWLPEKLDRHVKHLENSPHVGVSFSRSAFIDEQGEHLNSYTRPKLKGFSVPDLLRSNPLGNGSAALYRRQVFKDIEFRDNLRGYEENCYFDEKICNWQDIESLLRIALKTDWKIEGLSEPLTLYRVTSGGLSANFVNTIKVWESLLDGLENDNPEAISQWKRMSMAYHLRFLAQKGIRIRKGKAAVEFINQALTVHWRLLFEEPSSTITTFIAAYLLWLTPQAFYRQTEAFVLTIKGVIQRPSKKYE